MSQKVQFDLYKQASWKDLNPDLDIYPFGRASILPHLHLRSHLHRSQFPLYQVSRPILDLLMTLLLKPKIYQFIRTDGSLTNIQSTLTRRARDPFVLPSHRYGGPHEESSLHLPKKATSVCFWIFPRLTRKHSTDRQSTRLNS